MTTRSRNFLIGAAALLFVGLGGGLVAYYSSYRAAAVAGGLPVELRYVPADAALVAYADVQAVMNSQMRRELERMAMGPRRGRQQMHEFAGIDLEKDVNRVVAYVQSEPVERSGDGPPHVLVLAQGKYDQSAIEQFVQDHGGTLQDYHGKHFLTRTMQRRGPAGSDGRPQAQPGEPRPGEPSPSPNEPSRSDNTRRSEELAIALVQPDLIAIGPAGLVRAAIDWSAATASLMSNTEMMKAITDAASGDAWVVGRFDAVSRRMGLPSAVRTQVPPLRLVSASAQVNGSVKATIKAETSDSASADQLRDVVRGAISLVRLQAGAKPELQEAMKSLELGGTGTNVQLSFLMTPDTLRAMAPGLHPPQDQQQTEQPKPGEQPKP